MSEQAKTEVTRGFWILSGVFLVWNLMGVMAFVTQMTITDEALAALPEAQQNLYLGTPAWANVAFAFAVFGGTLGCVLLLMRNSLAVVAFSLSLAGIAVQMFHAFVLSPALQVLGPAGLVMPIMIAGAAVFLLRFAKSSRAKGLLT